MSSQDAMQQKHQMRQKVLVRLGEQWSFNSGAEKFEQPGMEARWPQGDGANEGHAGFSWDYASPKQCSFSKL